MREWVKNSSDVRQWYNTCMTNETSCTIIIMNEAFNRFKKISYEQPKVWCVQNPNFSAPSVFKTQFILQGVCSKPSLLSSKCVQNPVYCAGSVFKTQFHHSYLWLVTGNVTIGVYSTIPTRKLTVDQTWRHLWRA